MAGTKVREYNAIPGKSRAAIAVALAVKKADGDIYYADDDSPVSIAGSVVVGGAVTITQTNTTSVVQPSTTLGANFTSASVDVQAYSKYMLQIVRDSGGTSSGSFSLETSADNTNWSVYDGSVQSFDASVDANSVYEMVTRGHRYVRIVWTHSGGAGASVVVTGFFTSLP